MAAAILERSAAFNPDGRRLVSYGFDGRVKVWDWLSGVELLSLTPPGGGMLWHAVFGLDAKMIAVAGGDGVVTVWKVELPRASRERLGLR